MWRRAWLTLRKRKTRKTWAVCWYNDEGRLRETAAGPDKRFAESTRRRKEAEINSNTFGIGTTRGRSISLQDFREEHLKLLSDRVRPATLYDQERALSLFEKFAAARSTGRNGLLLEDISPRLAEAFVAERLSEGRSAATVNKDLRTLRGVFNLAAKRDYRLYGNPSQNPFSSVKKLAEPDRQLRVLSTDEVGKLLGACRSVQWRAFVFLALTTGLRKGELCWLEWQDVDLDAGLLWVRSKTEHETKSGKSAPVPLIPTAVTLLKRLKLHYPGQWVFQNKRGGRLANNVLRDFKTIVDRAGIAPCTVHDLRRTFCSHLQMVGVSEAVAGALARHASPDTTRKYYTGILPDTLREAPTRLSWARAG